MLGRSFNPILFNDFVFNRTKGGKQSKVALKIIQGFTGSVIKRRKEAIMLMSSNEADTGPAGGSDEDKRREPFLDTLIREHIRDPKHFTLRNIRDEVETFMFEGHDTTAWGVIWAVYIIGLHPEVQARIQTEVDSLYEALISGNQTDINNNNDDGSKLDEDLSLSDMKLPYTEACVKEAQRLYPSVAVFTRVTESEFKINQSTIIPAGVNIGIFPSIIHMNPEYFPEPEKFRPERFMTKDKRHPFAFVPFSAGPRNCIGQKFALLEEKALLAKIFRKFNITSLDPRETVVPCASLITKSNMAIRVKLETRK